MISMKKLAKCATYPFSHIYTCVYLENLAPNHQEFDKIYKFGIALVTPTNVADVANVAI